MANEKKGVSISIILSRLDYNKKKKKKKNETSETL
jgi:hypothetical protein